MGRWVRIQQRETAPNIAFTLSPLRGSGPSGRPRSGRAFGPSSRGRRERWNVSRHGPRQLVRGDRS